MPHDARTLLEHVQKATKLIDEFVRGRSLDDYRTVEMLHAAVEREFTIAGEALTRLEKLDPSLAARVTDYRKIVGFRNVLVHGYEAVDDAIVWQTIHAHLPILRSEIDDLLRGLDRS